MILLLTLNMAGNNKPLTRGRLAVSGLFFNNKKQQIMRNFVEFNVQYLNPSHKYLFIYLINIIS